MGVISVQMVQSTNNKKILSPENPYIIQETPIHLEGKKGVAWSRSLVKLVWSKKFKMV